MPDALYLEGLTVGQIFTAGPLTVTEAEIIAFARDYDPQPFHTDPEAAAAHPIFGGLAASGWHTAALTMRLTVQAAGRLGWAWWAAAASWPGPGRCGPATRCGWKRACWRSRHPARGPTVARHGCASPPSTSMTKRCSCSPCGCWCRVGLPGPCPGADRRGAKRRRRAYIRARPEGSLR